MDVINEDEPTNMKGKKFPPNTIYTNDNNNNNVMQPGHAKGNSLPQGLRNKALPNNVMAPLNKSQSFDPEMTGLPHGWIRKTNEDGVPFYYNTITRSNSFYHPLDPQIRNNIQSYSSTTSIQSYMPPSNPMPSMSQAVLEFNVNTPLPRGWKIKKTKDGETYYKNKETKEKSWYHPLSPEYQRQIEMQRKKSIESSTHYYNNNYKTFEQRKLEAQQNAEIQYDPNAAKKAKVAYSSPYKPEMYKLSSQSPTTVNKFDKKYKNKKQKKAEQDLKRQQMSTPPNIFNPELAPLPNKNWVRKYKSDGTTIYENVLTGEKSKYHPSDPNKNAFKNLINGTTHLQSHSSTNSNSYHGSVTPDVNQFEINQDDPFKVKKKKPSKRSGTTGFLGFGRNNNNNNNPSLPLLADSNSSPSTMRNRKNRNKNKHQQTNDRT